MTVTRKNNPSNFIDTINGKPLTNVLEHKYLGITLTSGLTWDTHIANVTVATLHKLFYLKRRLKTAPAPAKLLAYTMFIRPVLEYANIVWFPYSIPVISQHFMLSGAFSVNCFLSSGASYFFLAQIKCGTVCLTCMKW